MASGTIRASRWRALRVGDRPDRTVLSEYHGMGSTTGAFADPQWPSTNISTT